MAVVRHLGFSYFENFHIRTSLLHAKLRENETTRCRVMTETMLSNMATVHHLGFVMTS